MIPLQWLDLGLLAALLLERDAKGPLCRTPVGDDANRGLLSQLSMRLSCLVLLQSAMLLLVLCRASPRGPPMDVGSHEIGTQLVCLWFRSTARVPTPSPISSSRDSLGGEAVSFSFVGDEVEDMKSDVTIGMEMES